MIEIIKNKIGKPKFYATYNHDGNTYTGYGKDELNAIADALDKAVVSLSSPKAIEQVVVEPKQNEQLNLFAK